MATKRKIPVKRIKKTTKPKKVTSKKKPIGEFSGIMIPLPEFPSHLTGVQDLCLIIAKQLDVELVSLDEHQKNKYFDLQDMWDHIFNANINMDRILHLIIVLFHEMHYTSSSFGEIDKIKKIVKQVDEDFKKHRPKLEYIDKKVQEHQKSEERAKQLYG